MSTKGVTWAESRQKAAEMAELWKQGYTYDEIAKKHGVTKQWCCKRVMQALGKTNHKPGPKGVFTEAQWEWVSDRRKEGYTVQQLADFLGVGVATVSIHTDGIDRAELIPLEKRKAEFYRLAR